MTRIAPLLGIAALLTARTVSAQDAVTPTVAPDQPVEANGVGISGGIIAGAEVVLVPMAIIDHHRPIEPLWPWIVFPIVGAGGGGVGGYFLEQASPPGAVVMLVTALVGMIPTMVAVATARAYDPVAEGAVEGSAGGALFEPGTPAPAPTDETEVESRPEGIPDAPLPPPSDPLPPGADAPGTSRRDPPERSGPLVAALFHVSADGRPGLGLPLPEVRTIPMPPVSIDRPRQIATEVSFPLLRLELP